MKKLKSFYQRNANDIFAITFIIILSFLTHRVWFSFGKLVSAGDMIFRYDENAQHLFYSGNTWINYSGLGKFNIQISFYPIWALISLFNNIGLSYTNAIRILYLIPIALGGFLSPYFYARKNKLKTLPALCIAIFYGSTTYFLVRQTTHLGIAVSYAFAPVLFFLFEQAVHRQRFSRWIMFLIAAQIGMFYEIRSVYLFLFLAVFYILIQLIYKKISIKSLLKPLLLLLPVSLVLNAYWILPQILSLTNTNASDVVADFFERTTFGNNLYNLAYAFNIHDHSWTGGSLETFHPQTISLIAWIIPVLAFFLILQKRKKTEKLIFWLVAFVFMTFIGKQNAYPSKDSFDLLRTYLPGFRVIRTASLAYIYIGLSYLGIFVVTMRDQRSKIIKVIVPILFLVPSLFNLIPAFTGALESNFVAQELSTEYQQLQELIEADDGFYRTYWIPRASRWALKTSGHPAVSGLQLSNPNESNVSIESLLQREDLKQTLELAGIKYVVVPKEDPDNNDNVFPYYDLSREDILKKLDQLEFFKRLDNFNDITVYQTSTHRKELFTFNELIRTNQEGSSLNHLYTSSKNVEVSEYNIELFEEPEGQDVNWNQQSFTEEIDISKITTTDTISLKQDLTNRDILYKMKNNELTFYISDSNEINFNTHLLKDRKDVIVDQKKLSLGVPDFTVYDSEIIENPTDLPQILSQSKRAKPLVLYYRQENIVKNNSFEADLWNKKVFNCNRYDENPQIHMSRTKDSSSDGDYSLKLSTQRHIACSYLQMENLLKDSYYMLEFDYLLEEGATADVSIQLLGKKNEYINQKVKSTKIGWQKYQMLFKTKDDTNKVKLWLKSLETDNVINTVYFDNVNIYPGHEISLENKKLEQTYILPANQIHEGTNQLQLNAEHNNLKNLVAEGSFEKNLWNDNVIDCHNYDDNPQIQMYSVEGFSTEGSKALALETSNHIACTKQDIAVKEGKTYLLRFDVKTSNVASARYELLYKTDKMNYETEKIVAGNDWKTITKTFLVPEGVEELSLRLSGLESKNKRSAITYYDDVRFIELPYGLEEYSLHVSSELGQTGEQDITYSQILPTKYSITIDNITESFYMGFNSTYTDNWQLQTKTEGALIGDHFQVNNLFNGWQFDFQTICIEENLCSSSNGNYSIDLILDYYPQKAFYVGIFATIFGVFLSASLLIIVKDETFNINPKVGKIKVRTTILRVVEILGLFVIIFLLAAKAYLVTLGVALSMIAVTRRLNSIYIVFLSLGALMFSIIFYYSNNPSWSEYSLASAWVLTISFITTELINSILINKNKD